MTACDGMTDSLIKSLPSSIYTSNLTQGRWSGKTLNSVTPSWPSSVSGVRLSPHRPPSSANSINVDKWRFITLHSGGSTPGAGSPIVGRAHTVHIGTCTGFSLHQWIIKTSWHPLLVFRLGIFSSGYEVIMAFGVCVCRPVCVYPCIVGQGFRSVNTVAELWDVHANTARSFLGFLEFAR